MDIHFSKSISEAEKTATKAILEQHLSSNNGYKLSPIDEHELENTEWDESEEEFINRYGDCDLYYLLDCKVWENGQVIALVAVD